VKFLGAPALAAILATAALLIPLSAQAQTRTHTSKSSSFHSPEVRLADARLRISDGMG
jgi:hypothetical protein